MILIILTAGLASQWLSAALRIPAIVVLIAAGLALGPISGLIQFDVDQKAMAELIGLGVAIILFEGGMALKLGEARRVGTPRRTFLAGGLAAAALGAGTWAWLRPICPTTAGLTISMATSAA